MSPIATPCIKICTVEPRSGLCLGCGRTLDEIARWTAFSDGERARIMAELEERIETMLGEAADAAASCGA